MATWIGSLRATDAAAMWAVCREQGVWGSSATTAAGVQSGDALFVWWAGRGWFARCEYLDAPLPGDAFPAPWHDFRFVAPMRVLAELGSPHRSAGNPEPMSGLPTIRLGQFPQLTDAARIARLQDLFER